jgi:D-alanine-D-alanine ligase
MEVLPVVEFDLADPNAIQSQEAKLEKPIEKICPANISEELTQEMKRLARETFHALGIYDFARIDLRMDADGDLYILELNSMASLGFTGSYVHSVKVAGYTYDSMVNRMLDVAAARYFGKDYLQVSGDKEKKADETQPLRVRLRTYLRSHLTTMADNLERMIKINSFVHNVEGVDTLGDWISGRMTQLNFNRQVYPQTEVGNILYFTNHTDQQNDILLLGHLDTVYGYQDFVYFREDRGRFYGSGVAESKGGLAVMLGSLQALRFARRLKGVRCGVLLITDDVFGGRYSKKLVAEISQHSKYVVGLKYGGKAGGIVTSCGGRMEYTVELSNIKDTESAKPVDVISAISQKVVAWQKLSSVENSLEVKPVSLEARAGHGLTPDHATLLLDVRFKDQNQADELEKEIRKIARRGAGSKLHIRIKRGIFRPPLVETEQNRQFFERVQKTANLLETKTETIHRTASSAVCYVPEGIPVLEGLGPAGGNSRSPGEYIVEDSLIDRATLLALVIRESLKD